MKTNISRPLLILLALLTLLPLLASCGAKPGKTVMEYEGYTLSENVYTYWLSYYKTSFYDTFLESGAFTEENYSEIFWDTDLGGVTIGEIAKAQIDDTINKILVSQKLFDDLGLSFTEEETAVIDQYVARDVQNAGSRSALNKALSQFGLNTKRLADIYLMEAKCQKVRNYFWGDNGIELPDAAAYEAYYQENYIRYKQIYIRTKDKDCLDENGDPIIDPSIGDFKVEELTAEERAEKIALADELEARLADGEDFEALMGKYGEDEGMTYYTDGYFASEGSFAVEYLDVLKEMKTDEVRRYETGDGIYLLKKYPLTPGAYNAESSEAFFTGMDSMLMTQLEEDKFRPLAEKITKDEEFFTDMTIKNCPLYDFGA